MNREIESQPSPNIIPDWYEEHKQKTKIHQVERTEEEKEQRVKNFERIYQDYLVWRDG
ncbi:hypothetical protein [Gracilibacillus thailandensis]|uniref:Uncharacterized protein n=1 Tax=Gracilibacillus thailandensis TaxID=563735 RepID=A0A6N7QW66_9BACI|nr:hypothetical protein [Gracilibacillus thailandensis]MRI65135.1 hypothetical protein [Gracilibacillus thailandensis]